MTDSIKLGAYLTLRVTSATRQKFHDRAKKFGKPADVHREVIEAFIDDRLTITKPEKESLYVD
jgi:hypothetical protein